MAVDSLRKVYRGGRWWRRSDIHALQGVSLSACRGQVFGLLGPNGAGKTTLIKILLGVIRSSGGRASLFGLPAGSTPARRRVGYLPESLRVDRHHTARSALSFYGRLSGLDSKAIRDRSDELLELVGLSTRDRESVKRFSKGMLQRLGLAQALMHDPDLLVLDEPTDGLDPVGRQEVRKVIERLRAAGKTIFLNSHILHEVELVCTHLAIMAHGEVLASGSLDELRDGGGSVGAWENGQGTRKTSSGQRTRWDVRWPAQPPGLDDLAAGLGSVRFLGNPGVPENSGVPENPGDVDGDHGPLVRPADASDTSPARQVAFETVCPDQAAIDAMVDRIRQSGGSVVSLQPCRTTLEDTFLELVSRGRSGGEALVGGSAVTRPEEATGSPDERSRAGAEPSVQPSWEAR